MPTSEFYNSNPNIKNDQHPTQFKPHQIKEVLLSKDDPEYFLLNHTKILSLDDGLVPFKLYDYQSAIIKILNKERFFIGLLARQMGKSAVVVGHILHKTLLHPNQKVCILANKAATAREILDKFKKILETIPLYMQPGVKVYNKGYVEFSNNSSVMAASTSSDSIRGFSFNCIILDEFAFVDNDETFWTSTYPVISASSQSQVIIISTPNGRNLFRKIYNKSITKENDFVSMQVTWDEHPDRDDEWKRQTIENIGQRNFLQEYECEFRGSGGTLINGDKLTELDSSEPITETTNTVIFEHPLPMVNYVVTVDVGEGNGGDNSVIEVTKVLSGKYTQVATFASNIIKVHNLPLYVIDIATKYNTAMVLVENNSIGILVSDYLWRKYEYENMILVKNGKVSRRTGYETGLRMTAKVKSKGCSTLKDIIEGGIYTINNHQTLVELESFVMKDNGTYSAQGNLKDDRVMVLVLFAWLTSTRYFVDELGVDNLDLLEDYSRKEIDDNLTPFIYCDDSVVDGNILDELIPIESIYSNTLFDDNE